MSKSFFWIFGALMLIGSESIVSAQAARQCTSEECACEEALRQNTIEALEAFLRKYPASAENGASACAALAIPPGEEGVESLNTDGGGQDQTVAPPADLSSYGG